MCGSLNRANGMTVYASFDCGDKVVMIIEVIEGISLKTFLEKKEPQLCSEAEVIPIFKQIVTAMAYCHSKGVCHRDLKLENILITPQNYVKIQHILPQSEEPFYHTKNPISMQMVLCHVFMVLYRTSVFAKELSKNLLF